MARSNSRQSRIQQQKPISFREFLKGIGTSQNVGAG
jgi:hypothetical protein